MTLSRLAAAVLVTASVLCAPGPADALAPAPPTPLKPLDLRGCVAYALDHNANLLSRRTALEQDESQYAKIHASEFPPITGTLQNQLQKQNSNFSQYNQLGLVPVTTFSQNLAQLGTTWNLTNYPSVNLQAAQAKRTVEADRDNLRRAQQQVVQDVTNDYFAVSVRRTTVNLDTTDRGYQQSLLDVARNNERVGLAAGVDVLRARVNELRAEATLATAISDEATSRETLAQEIGASPDQPFIFPDLLPEPALPTQPLDALIALAMSHRSDINAARETLRADALGNTLIDSDRLPTFQIGAAFGNQFSPTTYGEELQALGTTTTTSGGLAPIISPARGSQGFWELNATSTLNIGLIDYGARHAQHRAARAQIDAAQQALTATEYAVETDVRQAVRGAQTAAANLATYREGAAAGAESARIAQLQYKNGLISLTDATAAERDALSSQTDLVNARVTYIDAIVRLRISLGALDPLAIVDLRTP